MPRPVKFSCRFVRSGIYSAGRATGTPDVAGLGRVASVRIASTMNATMKANTSLGSPRSISVAYNSGETTPPMLKPVETNPNTLPNEPGGVTALATLALIQAQVPLNDPSVSRGIDYLQRVRDEFTYTVALKVSVFAQADPVKYRNEIAFIAG